MSNIKRHISVTFITSIISFVCLQAQVEVSYLTTKKFSKIGHGRALSFGIPVSESNTLRIHKGSYFYRDEDVATALPLIGFRKTLAESGIGFTSREMNLSILNKNNVVLLQKPHGSTRGIGRGLRGDLELDFGLRYRIIYVPNAPIIQFIDLKI